MSVSDEIERLRAEAARQAEEERAREARDADDNAKVQELGKRFADWATRNGFSPVAVRFRTEKKMFRQEREVPTAYGWRIGWCSYRDPDDRRGSSEVVVYQDGTVTGLGGDVRDGSYFDFVRMLARCIEEKFSNPRIPWQD